MSSDGFLNKLIYYTIDGPVTAIRGFVERQQSKHEPFYYYHRRYRRVPGIEDCPVDDQVCIFEADMQFARDRKVEQQIIQILRTELNTCYDREGVNAHQVCKKELADFEEASDNYETKYGDLGYTKSAYRCLLKQKQRMLRERLREREAG
ncbi:NADH dehydrogenase [ubiquinone] 1 beta subcomplex subunit 10 [Holothuria leucospilota]|uniref:NADH dehydrogenase [ubiquinone] 1 beta subcomplex subunit 10 n=1 Tax=Holothuria leucospilota TaxID=206669 RepID=A0A9Q1H9X0_HOLLE|nr:NADH dehydrogenase [ubiquinone] 1 beta subcomplex subunit 10 [Holothuria leucospilota]